MKSINECPKEDPVKAATYNPKEFRGQRISAWSAGSSKQLIIFSASWLPLMLLAILVVGIWYFWNGYAQIPIAPLPLTGEVQRFRQDAPNTIYGPFRLIASTTSVNYFVKLEDWQTGALIMTIFVRRGEAANVNVPLGTYRYKYAYGTNWYGPQNLFGHETIVAQAVMPLTFTQEPNQVRGKVIDFTPRITGNLKTVQGTRTNF